jgi:tRNA nucleotidyltransferase (CCA-adding enzyme)
MPENLLLKLKRLLPPEIHTLLKCASDVASGIDMPLYLVGGAVRDLLLDKSPGDLDLVVEGDVSALADKAAKATGGKTMSHKQFGTATLKVGKARLDIATARTEVYPRPGALPNVTTGTLKQDLLRRDFTINTLAVALSGHRVGKLVDPFKGGADLQAGLLRVLHNRSFLDDPTRIFRGIRYEQRFGFQFEAGTLHLLKEALAAGSLDTVTGDRLRRELELMFEEAEPLKSLLRARALGLFARLHPAFGDVPYLPKLEGQKVGEPLIHLAALAYGFTSKQASEVEARLNMPVEWKRIVNDAIILYSNEAKLIRREMPPIEICSLLDPLSPVVLQAGLLLAENPAVKANIELYLEKLRHVKPALNGDDLLRIGIPEGPRIGQVLVLLREARLQGRVTTREDEVKTARRLAQS